jgi:WD40 repeat protein
MNADQWSLGFSPNGRTLAATGTRAVVKLWDVTSHKEIPGITIEDTILHLSFSADSSLLAIGVQDGTTRLWTLADRQQIAIIPNYPYQTFSPDGRILVLKLWDVAKRADAGDLANDPSRQLSDTTFSPNGNLLASLDYPQQVLVWDTGNWVQPAPFPSVQTPTSARHSVPTAASLPRAAAQ